MTPVLKTLLWASVAAGGFAGVVWVLCRAARAKQGKLGEKQAALGEQQGEASRRAYAEIRRLIEQTLSSSQAMLLE